MLTIRFRKNMVFGTTEAEDVLPARTIGRVAAGAVASLLLKELGITVTAYTKSIGPYTVKADAYHLSEISENPLFMPKETKSPKRQAAIWIP